MDKGDIVDIYIFTSFTAVFDYWLWEKEFGFESSRRLQLNTLECKGIVMDSRLAGTIQEKCLGVLLKLCILESWGKKIKKKAAFIKKGIENNQQYF